MKTKKIILFGILFAFFACNTDDHSQPDIDGNYIGFFERNGNTSNVELKLENGIFSGESEIVKFPAICNGNYSILSNSMNFENLCPWTAEFDWSLILSDSWNYSFENNTLTLTKSNGDKYILEKQ